MRITVYGKGNVGGGLADRWEAAGHMVTRLGRGGGDVSGSDVVLVAVPGTALAAALDDLTGLEGKIVVDATNLIRAGAPDGYASNAEYVKSRTNGPTAKSFSSNFAALYDRLPAARATPSNLWCGDEGAREAVELLIRDAGYEPVYAGSLANAQALERFIDLVFAIAQAGTGPFVYRIAAPEQL